MTTNECREFIAALDHVQQLSGFIDRLIDAAPVAASEVYENWKSEWPTAIDTDPRDRKMPQAAEYVMTGFDRLDSMYRPYEKISELNIKLWSATE